MATCGPAWSDAMAKPGAGPSLTPPLGDELARLEEIVRKLEPRAATPQRRLAAPISSVKCFSGKVFFPGSSSFRRK